MEDRIVSMAMRFADNINGSTSPRSAVYFFAEAIACNYYLVSKEDAERVYNSYKNESGWSEDSDFVSSLESLIPELTDD